MSIILSLQGCMAAGKTAAVHYIKNNAPYVNISYETNTSTIDQIKSRHLDKNVFKDYIEIQKLWIENEIVRWERAQNYDCTIMDFGAEEIEFYTLNYPKAIGVNWDVEDKLQNELENLKKCMPNRILFLDASESVLRSHKENDKIRSRNFFEYYLKYLLPLKKEWFLHKKNVDILNVDKLNENEVGEEVKIWIDNIISNNENVNNTRE
jgi:hypothetical protein